MKHPAHKGRHHRCSPEKGWATTAHIPALRQLPQFCLSGNQSSPRDAQRLAAEVHGALRYFDSAQELIHHPDVDLVVVAVKVTRHKDIVLSAMQAGKAVLCEWPLGMNLPDAVAMRDCAREMRVTTAVGLQPVPLPYSPFSKNWFAKDTLATYFR